MRQTRYPFALLLATSLFATSLFATSRGDDNTPANTCSPRTCNGCRKDAHAGHLDGTCGLGGGACAVCGASCKMGQCEGPSRCDTGCLDAQQACQPGDTNDACGTSGTDLSCAQGACINDLVWEVWAIS